MGNETIGPLMQGSHSALLTTTTTAGGGGGGGGGAAGGRRGRLGYNNITGGVSAERVVIKGITHAQIRHAQESNSGRRRV